MFPPLRDIELHDILTESLSSHQNNSLVLNLYGTPKTVDRIDQIPDGKRKDATNPNNQKRAKGRLKIGTYPTVTQSLYLPDSSYRSRKTPRCKPAVQVAATFGKRSVQSVFIRWSVVFHKSTY